MTHLRSIAVDDRRLWVAVRAGAADQIRDLVRQGANPNASVVPNPFDGVKPLWIDIFEAPPEKRLATLQALRAAGMRWSPAGKDKTYLAHHAVLARDWELARYVRDEKLWKADGDGDGPLLSLTHQRGLGSIPLLAQAREACEALFARSTPPQTLLKNPLLQDAYAMAYVLYGRYVTHAPDPAAGPLERYSRLLTDLPLPSQEAPCLVLPPLLVCMAHHATFSDGLGYKPDLTTNLICHARPLFERLTRLGITPETKVSAVVNAATLAETWQPHWIHAWQQVTLDREMQTAQELPSHGASPRRRV